MPVRLLKFNIFYQESLFCAVCTFWSSSVLKARADLFFKKLFCFIVFELSVIRNSECYLVYGFEVRFLHNGVVFDIDSFAVGREFEETNRSDSAEFIVRTLRIDEERGDGVAVNARLRVINYIVCALVAGEDEKDVFVL